MIRYFELIVIFICLFIAILLILKQSQLATAVHHMYISMRNSLAARDRKTGIEKRKMLGDMEMKGTFWIFIDRQLEYSGLRRRFNWLTSGKFLVMVSIVFIMDLMIGVALGNIKIGVYIALAWFVFVFLFIKIGKSSNLKKVSDELPKFLDFLGSYSISSGEIMSIFSKISVYLEEPLSTCIDECVAESRISGDPGMALLSMAEKIEHPQFKQLMRNIEITSRYSADFTSLVADSRRSLREYLAQNREKKAMIREATINMSLLLIMSVIVMMMVNMLIGGSILDIILHTTIGHIACGGMVFIICLFGMQAMSMDK